MNKNKLSKNKKVTVATSLLVLIGLAAGSFLFWPNTKQDVASAEPISKPFFSFDKDRANDWWTHGNNWPDIKEYTGNQITDDDLPVADIVVFRGKQGEFGDKCFVTAMYNKGPVDTTAAVQKRKVALSDNQNGLPVVTSTGASTLKMQTPEGSKEYTMHRFNVDAPNIQQGNEFGFIPLTEGHIEVRGVCPTADMLSETDAVLTAITLHPKKQ